MPCLRRVPARRSASNGPKRTGLPWSRSTAIGNSFGENIAPSISYVGMKSPHTHHTGCIEVLALNGQNAPYETYGHVHLDGPLGPTHPQNLGRCPDRDPRSPAGPYSRLTEARLVRLLLPDPGASDLQG